MELRWGGIYAADVGVDEEGVWLESRLWEKFVATEGRRKVWVAPFMRDRVLCTQKPLAEACIIRDSRRRRYCHRRVSIATEGTSPTILPYHHHLSSRIPECCQPRPKQNLRVEVKASLSGYLLVMTVSSQTRSRNRLFLATNRGTQQQFVVTGRARNNERIESTSGTNKYRPWEK